MRPLVALAVVIALGAAAGVYVATRGGSSIPKGQRSAILEKAKAAGIIHRYRVLFHPGTPCLNHRAYGIDQGEVAIRFERGSCFGPYVVSRWTPEIYYTLKGHDRALALWRLIDGGLRIQCGPGCIPEKEVSR